MVLKPVLFSRMVQMKQLEEVQAAGIQDLESCPFCDFATIPPPNTKVFLCYNQKCMRDSCRSVSLPLSVIQNWMLPLSIIKQNSPRMASSGMLHSVALVRTDVSEKLSGSIIRATRIGELGTTLAVTSNRHTLRRNSRNIPEDAILHSHRRGNHRSYNHLFFYLIQEPSDGTSLAADGI
jgi:hypothetical protein